MEKKLFIDTLQDDISDFDEMYISMQHDIWSATQESEKLSDELYRLTDEISKETTEHEVKSILKPLCKIGPQNAAENPEINAVVIMCFTQNILVYFTSRIRKNCCETWKETASRRAEFLLTGLNHSKNRRKNTKSS